MSLRLILGAFTAILIFTSGVATAELNSVLPRNVQFSNLDTEVGLSSEFVHDVEQDTLGFMWFATQSGLNRFDGHEVRVYENNANDPNTIGHSFVWDIYRAEEEGDLWLGTERGVSYYSHKEDRFYREPFPALSLTDYRVRQIVQDSKGVFWLGTLGEGLLRIDPESNSLTQFELDEADNSSLPNNHVMSLLIDQRGQLWIGTDGGGLARFDNGNQSFVRYQGHGTHIAGLVAGTGALSRGEFRGISSRAALLSLKVLNNEGKGKSSSVLNALDWILKNGDAHGIKVVNLSFGKPVTQSCDIDPLCQAVEMV